MSSSSWSSDDELLPVHRADAAALRKLRDASGALKEYFGGGDDPRAWKGVTVRYKDDRVTKLVLYECTKLAALPAAIGGLTALTELNLRDCSSLAALPEAIGELGALTYLGLQGCLSLTALPAAIGELKALTWLYLKECSSLVALPDSIGELGALKRLELSGCKSLVALPESIGELKALTMLDLEGCSNFEKLPDTIVGREGLTVVLPDHLVPGSLDEDFAVLRKLRDESECAVVPTLEGDKVEANFRGCLVRVRYSLFLSRVSHRWPRGECSHAGKASSIPERL